VQLRHESNPALNTVTAYDAHAIEINGVRYAHAVYFAPEGPIHAWDVAHVSDITQALLLPVAGVSVADPDPMALLDDAEGAPALHRAADAPEVILIGTGLHQRFLAPDLLHPLLALGAGIEIMSTQAAARTYNILMAEGRRVVAALLPCKEEHP